MLLGELFFKAIARSHASQSEEPENGEMIPMRLRDVQSRAQVENDPREDSGEGGIPNAPSSGLESK